MIWKDIKGYEGLYQVSDTGLVKSVGRVVPHKSSGKLTVCEKMLSLKDRNGYLHVALWASNKVKIYKVHRLVCYAFIENPLNKPMVNHKDGNPKNNHVDNLEWVTAKENARHAIEIGLSYHPIGEDLTYSKLTDEIVIEMRKLRNSGMQYPEIAKMYGVSIGTTIAACTGRTWKHLNFPPVAFKKNRKLQP